MLESWTIVGSERVDSEELAEAVGLHPGLPIDDSFVASLRARILSFGLYKDCFLTLGRGSRPGAVKLVVHVEDDDTVLTDWAMGSDVRMTYGELPVQQAEKVSPPLGYRMGLVFRNIFSSLHRASFMADIDAGGNLRAGEAAYGLPRFAKEGVQFDALVSASDVHYRYLDTMGFGLKSQLIWSQGLPRGGEFIYGLAMYQNDKGEENDANPRGKFAVPNFPRAVNGPKIGYVNETRLIHFIPGEGHRLSASIIIPPTETELTTPELQVSESRYLWNDNVGTIDAKALLVGSHGYSFRMEGRGDFPVTGSLSELEDTDVFVRLRGGFDIYNETRYFGSAVIFGVRYHSDGLIAEIGVQLSHAPSDLTPSLNTIAREP